tara:strand:- start:1575 stop:2864 length:1290 start_codon:yes stop_codon:yes gene_type:complete
MIKNFVFILIFALSYGESFSQSKYGIDSISCITNLSLFREYYKQKNYKEALTPWRWTFQNCPKASGNIYKNGPIIIKSLIKARPEQKKEYVDTLMLIYDQRIEYFGNEGYVLGRKGADLLRYDKSKFLDANQILARSIAMQKNSSDAGAILAYFNTLDLMVKNEIILEDSLLNRYSFLMSIIDYNLKKNDKKSKFYQKTSDAINKKIVNYIDCGKIENIFKQKFTINNNDTDFVNRLYNILSKQNCTETEFHFQVSKRLYEMLPLSSSASKLGKICIKRKEFNQAIEYFDMAVENEVDKDKKAKYLLEKADAYRISKNYSNAILTAKQSIELKKNWGEAFITIGNIYVAGAGNCSSDFEKSTVYWVAVDYFTKALSDESANEIARKSINTYSKYFPTKEECFFNGSLQSGDSYTVECWINKRTTVRTSD